MLISSASTRPKEKPNTFVRQLRSAATARARVPKNTIARFQDQHSCWLQSPSLRPGDPKRSRVRGKHATVEKRTVHGGWRGLSRRNHAPQTRGGPPSAGVVSLDCALLLAWYNNAPSSWREGKLLWSIGLRLRLQVHASRGWRRDRSASFYHPCADCRSR